MLDLRNLRIRIFEHTGLKLGRDDPVFAAIYLFDAVLADHEQRVADLATRLDALSVQLAQASRPDWKRLARVIAMIVLAGGLGGAVGGLVVRQYMAAAHLTALTPDDARHLANGKRLAQILPKLDQQTRLKLDAAWQNLR